MLLPLFTHTNLVNINTNVGISIFLNVVLPQNLVFAPGAPINMVCILYMIVNRASNTVLSRIVAPGAKTFFERDP